jgi:predicted type IV restriction endonuclease
MNQTTTKPVATLSLADLRELVGLNRDRMDRFFDQWLNSTPILSDYEQQALTRLRCNYENILESSPLEEVVKLVVVAPLLDLAGFYQPPFSIRTEASTELTLIDEGITLTGSIDVLVVQQRFWVLVVESKQSKLDVTSGIPQTLSYLLSQPIEAQSESTLDRFGMVTNGREVVFLKLQAQQPPTFTQSRIYQVVETQGSDLIQILQGLKAIGQVIAEHH